MTDSFDPERLREFKNLLDGIGTSTNTAVESFKNLAVSAGVSFNQIIESAKNASDETIASLLKIGLVVEPLVGVLDKTRLSFGNLANAGTDAANSLTKDFQALGPIFNTAFKLFENIPFSAQIKQVAQSFSLAVGQGAESVRKLEVGLVQTAAASGRFNQFLENVGDNFQQLDRRVSTYNQLINDTAVATNTSRDAIANFATQLAQIPGGLDRTIELLGTGIRPLNELTAGLRFAAGSGQRADDVFSQLSEIFQDFGIAGEDAFIVLDQISQASRRTELPLQNVRQFAKQAADSFLLIGENSQGALEILNRFAPALRDAGLGPRAIQSLVGGVVQRVSGLDIAQRAFLSQQTGGPGGLRGSFQVRQELEQDPGAVFERVRQSLLQQFGGRVATLEQAAQSEDAAAQLTRQIAFLTQGPTAIARDENEAIKLIEAFASESFNVRELSQSLKTPQEELADTLRRGEKFQETQVNILTRAAITLDNQLALQALTYREIERSTAGDRSPIANQILQDIRDSQARSANLGVFEGRGTSEVTPEEAELQNARDVKRATNLAVSGLQELGKEGVKRARDVVARPRENETDEQIATREQRTAAFDSALGLLLGDNTKSPKDAEAETSALLAQRRTAIAPPTGPNISVPIAASPEQVQARAQAQGRSATSPQEVNLNLKVDVNGLKDETLITRINNLLDEKNRETTVRKFTGVTGGI